ncbi:gephyrin-like molybdotransferase Glp [Iningainema tapete]|uniref:Molybdopterin molybdenumtransferase n=1 Tax=Iningainema tapete BLCC-T55 TaxID=2748662 RepID=A0A8J6XYM5_9CYAN|nr:gephyrin-like molybdotransferase Glp [Iningainema tapete]MBD2775498.1 molybdopterin molybdotransferase MoeA [Iningainema tapete BLCC-T55]
MLQVSEAEAIILNLVQPLDPQQDTEFVDLLTADGRILATPVTSQLDFPQWDNSAMDGYCVRYEDVQHCSAEHPAVLEIVEEITPGKEPQSTIQPGQAARILTGALIPTGADTVVMQEVTRREENRVFIEATPQPQQFIRQRGSYYQAGTQLLPAGIKLNAPEIGVLAASQSIQPRVYRRVRVSIISTGSELVTPDTSLQTGQIVDSNQYALFCLVKQAEAKAHMLGIVKDDVEAIEQAIASAVANSDIVISSGGVSVGDYDYIEKIIESLGGKIHFNTVAMKPGKPLTFATFSRGDAPVERLHDTPDNDATDTAPIGRLSCLYFGLPGNPVSALVTYWRFVQPTIKKLSGLTSGWEPKFVKALTPQDLYSDGKRETYLWGQLSLNGEGVYEFHLASGSHSSGNLINLAQTNSLAVLPAGTTSVSKGEHVKVLQVGNF